MNSRRCPPPIPLWVLLESALETRRVEKAIRDLPPSQRAAISLRHQEGLSYSRIAEVMDLSVSAVESPPGEGQTDPSQNPGRQAGTWLKFPQAIHAACGGRHGCAAPRKITFSHHDNFFRRFFARCPFVKFKAQDGL